MRTLLIMSFFAFFMAVAHIVDEKHVYLTYSSEDENVLYSELLEQIMSRDLIFFGELHN